MDQPTGESLFAEDNYDYIPGATVFYKPDNNTSSSNSAENVQYGELPSNPEDYLRSVQEEAKRCPNVVVAPLDSSKVKRKPTNSTLSFLKASMPGSEHAPSKKWCDDQVAHFSNARQELVHHMAQLKSVKRQSKKRPKLPIYPLPTWDDEENWRYLCLGNTMKPIDENSKLDANCQLTSNGAHSEEDDDGKEQVLVDALAAAGKSVNATPTECDDSHNPEDHVINLSTLEEGYQPLLRILLRMEAKQVQYNLNYHVSWLKTYGFSSHQGRWIYALMSCLEKPLYPTVTSTLRDLARQCALLRTKVDPDSDEMKGLNLIICIVGKYFDQGDLLDPM